jgi:hypothetical protein
VVLLDDDSLHTVRAALAARAADERNAWIVFSHEPLDPAGDAAVVLDLDAIQR